MHRLVILGSLGEFVQLIRMAKKRGYYTIVCDGYPSGIGKSYADKAYNIPVGNIDEIVAMCKAERADGIITSFSDYLFECMVKIAAGAGLKCYFDPAHLSLYRNKADMKAMFQALGIRSSAHTVIRRDFRDDELSKLRFPVVVKPLDKYGSRGVEVLYSPEEVRDRFDHTCATSENKTVLVEEYNDGFEFNMMTWVLNGRVRVISIADREKSVVSRRDIPISSRNVYPSKRMDLVMDEAVDILQRIADHTGQTSGPLSMQFFYREGEGVSVCEVAGRFFGYEHELVTLSGGLNIEKLLLDAVYDEAEVERTFAGYDPHFPKVSAVLYFHGRPGLCIVNQSKAHALALTPGVVDAWLFYREGEEVILHGSNPYVARYYIVGDSREEIDRTTDLFFREMTITDEQGREVLYRNQRGA